MRDEGKKKPPHFPRRGDPEFKKHHHFHPLTISQDCLKELVNKYYCLTKFCSQDKI